MVAEQDRRSPKTKTRPPRSHRLVWPLMLLAFLIGLADIVLVTQDTAPLEANVSDTDYRLVSVIRRSADPDAPPSTSSLLSSTLTITVPRQLKTRYLSITGVDLFSEDGERLGSSTLSSVMSSWEPVRLPGQDVIEQASRSVPAESSIPLSPFGETRITLRATAQQDLGLEPGDGIYAEIEAAADGTEFAIRSDLGLTTASEA